MYAHGRHDRQGDTEQENGNGGRLLLKDQYSVRALLCLTSEQDTIDRDLLFNLTGSDF